MIAGMYWVWRRQDVGGWAFQFGATGPFKSPVKYRTLATIEEEQEGNDTDNSAKDDDEEEGQKRTSDKKKLNHIQGMGIELGTLGRSDTM